MSRFLTNTVGMFLIFTIATSAKAQNPYLKSNELTQFSFKTTTGKTLMLAIDSSKKYIIYRYGDAVHVDLEYPKDLSNSFAPFKRFYYVRYGGAENAGTEISQIEFINEGFTYKIYEQSFMEKGRDRYEIGVTVENNTCHKRLRIKGIVKTKKGSLLALKESELIKQSSEAFDH